MSRRWLGALGLALALAGPSLLSAQGYVPPRLKAAVLPTAERFDEEASGDPPVYRGWATGPDGLEYVVGYVFHTPDVPPERMGYSGPIETVVGMDLDGRITGVRITDYWESIRSSMGDFLREPGLQEQFAGKPIGDAFLVGEDVDGVSRATISAQALARGVRDAARRVAEAYLATGTAADDEATDDFETLSWLELRRRGLVERMALTGAGNATAEVDIAFLENDAFGEILVGPRAMAMVRRGLDAAPGSRALLYGLDGTQVRLFARTGWAVVQDGDTIPVPESDVRPFGLASGGLMADELITTGMMLLPPAVDADRAFTLAYRPEPTGRVFTADVRTQAARLGSASEGADRTPASTEPAGTPPRVATGAPAEPGSGDPVSAAAPPSTTGRATSAPRAEPDSAPAGVARGAPPALAGRDATSDSPSARPPSGEPAPTVGDAPTAPAAPTPGIEAPQEAPERVLVAREDETLLERALARTPARRVAGMLLALMLASAALLTKRRVLRGAALTFTLIWLGVIDGGFLSVSHVTSAIWVGPGVFLNDLPLLLLVGFTLATTVLWGRVFCGYLCPFGALQDLLDRIVPQRFRRSLSPALHRRALWIKYGVLALIVGSALSGSHRSLYPYFEPFGTVFFGTTSLTLIAIAAAFVLASAVIPRFYCRYACPLGAALAVGSVLTLFRIPRVEQCTVCKVCEQRCPTGAIAAERVDFKECVRCNVCEIQLRERTGVCRHDMETVRPRLVQLRRTREGAHVG
ncbi:MAG: 4Fe-4S binding protein [Gemmatimonadetes bacterium]|nr:4Fe-4S binding protein [Gemmatimonadota bacterium]